MLALAGVQQKGMCYQICCITLNDLFPSRFVQFIVFSVADNAVK